MKRLDLSKRPMRCTCFSCLSMFTEGSGPETPKWERSKGIDNATYVCPGCKHITTMQEWMILDAMLSETMHMVRIEAGLLGMSVEQALEGLPLDCGLHDLELQCEKLAIRLKQQNNYPIRR